MEPENAVAAAWRKRGREEDRMEVDGSTEAVTGLASEDEGFHFELAKAKGAMMLEAVRERAREGFMKRSVDPEINISFIPSQIMSD